MRSAVADRLARTAQPYFLGFTADVGITEWGRLTRDGFPIDV
jgi:hypothetical protein